MPQHILRAFSFVILFVAHLHSTIGLHQIKTLQSTQARLLGDTSRLSKNIAIPMHFQYCYTREVWFTVASARWQRTLPSCHKYNYVIRRHWRHRLQMMRYELRIIIIIIIITAAAAIIIILLIHEAEWLLVDSLVCNARGLAFAPQPRRHFLD